jgi:molybdenum cofactor biosynthesis enzyme MoaA
MNNIRGAYVEITGKCNERCPYCYNEKLMIKGQELPFEIVCSLSEQLTQGTRMERCRMHGYKTATKIPKTLCKG